MATINEDHLRRLADVPNMSKREIARICKVNVKTVVRHMKKRGVTLTCPSVHSWKATAALKPAKQVDVEVLNGYVKNHCMTLGMLSNEIGVHRMSLKKQLKTCGLSVLTIDEVTAIHGLLALNDLE